MSPRSRSPSSRFESVLSSSSHFTSSPCKTSVKMSTSSLTSTLSCESIELLRSNGDLGSLNNGFRQIAHRSYTGRPTPGFLDVPEIIESAETFVYMGLREEIANNIQAALVRQKNDLGIEVSPYEAMKARIKGCTINACGTDEDYLPVYQAIGYDDRAANKLNNPRLQEWKNAYSAKEIALMAAESSWLFISTLDGVIKNTPSAGVNEPGPSDAANVDAELQDSANTSD